MGEMLISSSSTSHRKNCCNARYRLLAVAALWRSSRWPIQPSTWNGLTFATSIGPSHSANWVAESR